MKSFLLGLTVLVGCAVAQVQQQPQPQGQAQPRYVFDMYRNAPALDAEAVIDLMASAQPGVSFPLNHDVPNTGFDCGSQATPGYFADPLPPSLCQAFYRCDPSGNKTGFLCPNETLFNQLTLVCDYYFNVDCAGARNLYNFANSRLYQPGEPLFDTPPKGYISLLSGIPSDSEQPPQGQVITGSAAGRSDEPGPTAPVKPASSKPVSNPVNLIILPAVPPKWVAATTTSSTTTTTMASTTTGAVAGAIPVADNTTTATDNSTVAGDVTVSPAVTDAVTPLVGVIVGSVATTTAAAPTMNVTDMTMTSNDTTTANDTTTTVAMTDTTTPSSTNASTVAVPVVAVDSASAGAGTAGVDVVAVTGPGVVTVAPAVTDAVTPLVGVVLGTVATTPAPSS